MMLGLKVEFPVSQGIYESGTVTLFNEESGVIIVETDDGYVWMGFEHQVINVVTAGE